MSTSTRLSMLLLAALLAVGCCYSATIPRSFDSRINEDVVMSPKKRPFCNAFTGCGRKRSQGSPGMPVQEFMKQRQYVEDEALADENAIEELSRQILSEAKLWEDIQEASAEFARRKQKEIYNQ